MKKVPRFNPENYCHFVTVKTYGKNPLFSDGRIARLFLDVLYKKQSKLSFLLIGFVVMTDHVHLLIVPDKRNTISDVLRHVKGAFSRELGKALRRNQQTASAVAGGSHPPGAMAGMNSPPYGRGVGFVRQDRPGGIHLPDGAAVTDVGKIWQDSFHDRSVRDPRELCAKLQYMELNPVRAGLVNDPKDYEFSSANGKFATNLESYL